MRKIFSTNNALIVGSLVVAALAAALGVALVSSGDHHTTHRSTPAPSATSSPSSTHPAALHDLAALIRKLPRDKRITKSTALVDAIRRVAPAVEDRTLYFDAMTLWYAQREAQGGDPADVAETIDDINLLRADLDRLGA